MTQVPGVYIPIRGDYKQLPGDMAKARQIVTESAQGMSKALDGALSPRQVGDGTKKLIDNLNQLSRSSKITAQDFNKLGVDLGQFQGVTGLTARSFQELQQRMLQTQGARAQEKSLRDIAKAANLSEREVRLLGSTFGMSKAQIANVTDGMNKLGKETHTTAGRIKDMIVTVGLYTVAFGALYQTLSIVKKGVFDFNAQMEVSGLGIASAFLTAGEYVDQQTGKVLDGVEAFQAAQGESKAILEELKSANFATIATLDQLVRAYQETLPVAMRAGFDKSQVQEFTTAMIQAAGAIDASGALMHQLGEETRSLLTGTINPRTSRIATVLGVTNEDVRKFKGDADGMFDYLMDKLSAYKIAGTELQNTWKGLTSNFIDVVTQSFAMAGEPIFEAVKSDLKSIVDSIVVMDETTKQLKWSEDFTTGIQNTKTVLTSIIAEFRRFGMLIDLTGGTLTQLGAMVTWGETDKKFREWNSMFEQRYNEGDKKLQEMANREIGLNADGTRTTVSSSVKFVPNKPGPDQSDIDALVAAEKERLAIVQRMNQLKIDFMPAGLDKELAQFNQKYVSDINEISTSQKIGKAAAEEYYKTLAGTKAQGEAKITAQWMTKYKDSVEDISISLDKLTNKDKTLSTVDKELGKIETGFEKWRNSAATVVEQLSGSTNPAVVTLSKEVQGLIGKSKELEPTMKKAFQAETIRDFEKELNELNESFSVENLGEYERRLKSINDEYDEQVETARELWGQSKQYYIELKKIEIARKQAIADDATLNKTGTNMWKGFVQGVKDAEKELKSLGQLGYEVFGDLQDGLSGTIVKAMKGQFDEIGDLWKDMLSKMEDNVLTFFADKLSTKALSTLFNGADSIFGSALGGIFGEISGTNSATYTGGAMNVFVTNSVGGLVGGGTGVTGAATSGWGKIGGGIALAGGAYGLYSGAKDVKDGNAGVGAVKMGLGGYSAYQGAVTLGIIEKGTATGVAKGLAAKFGMSQAAGYGSTAYTAGSGATSYSTFQAAGSTAGAAGGSSGVSSGVAATGATAAAYAVPIAAAVLVAMGAYNKSQRPQAENEIDKLGITPNDLGQFYQGWNDIKGTILSTVPVIADYETALYDANSQLLVAQGTAGTLALAFNASAEAGNQWSDVLRVANSEIRDSVIAADEFTSSMNVAGEGMGKAAEIAYIEREAMDTLSAALNGSADAAAYLRGESGQLSLAAEGAANSTAYMAATVQTMGSISQQAADKISGAWASIEGLSEDAKSFGAGYVVGPSGGGTSFHADGGIFTRRTRIGNHVFGEKENELLAPIPGGPNVIKDLIKSQAMILSMLQSGGGSSSGPIIIQIDGKEVFRATLPYNDNHFSQKAARGQEAKRTVF